MVIAVRPFPKWFGVVALGLCLAGCFKEADLNHPDDPEGDNYILVKGDGCPIAERIDIHSARLFWVWSQTANNTFERGIEKVLIHRYYSSGGESSGYVPDTLIKAAPYEIEFIADDFAGCVQDSESVVRAWTDNSLTIERDYKYIIWFEDEYGISAKDSITILYSHEFKNIDSISLVQWRSDTSLTCTWQNSENFHDQILLRWAYSNGEIILDTIVYRTVDSLALIDRFITLNRQTTVEIFYGHANRDSTIWQRNPSTDTLTLVFPAVNDLAVIPFTENANRLTWRYSSTKVKPEQFVIAFSGDSLIIPNAELVKQQIDGRMYFTYYDQTAQSSTVNYRVYPKTRYHIGVAKNITSTRNVLLQDLQGFCYVDTVYLEDYTSGFYISLYEMTISEFIADFNMYIQDSIVFINNVESWRDIIQINNNNQLELIDDSVGDHPIDLLTWTLADMIARRKEHNRGRYRLPTEREWKQAARAFSKDGRTYPWGFDDPDKSFCNYDSENGTIPVDTLSNGRVDIFWHQQIKGPFHMSGNVREWVADTTFTYRGAIAYMTKGGGWNDKNKELLEIEDNTRVFTSIDAVGGIRLIKTF